MPSRAKSGVQLARDLRRHDTDAERKLWARLRSRQVAGAKFRRQQPLRPFVADFCCLDSQLVIEVDGGQHASNAASDAARSEYLNQHGYRVLRFWDHEVLQNTDAVVERIAAALNALTPTLPQGERG